MRLLVLTLVLVGLIPAQEKEPPTLRTLVKDLASDRTNTWLAAQDKFVKAGTEAVPLLIPHLQGDKAELRFLRIRVVKVLGRLGEDAKAARPALEKVMEGGDKLLANLAARSLVQIDPKHAPATDRLIKGRDPVSKMMLSRCLGEGGGSAAVSPLLKLLRDRHRGVRDAAARGLANLVAAPDVEVSGPQLLSLLEIEHHIVRRAAMKGLVGMNNPPRATAEKVRPLLTSLNAEERIAAIHCLCELKPPPAWLMDALMARLEDSKAKVRRAARISLLIHDPDAVKRLFAAKDWQKRKAAAKVLRWVQVEDESARAISLLVRLLQDPEAQVRATAATSLGELAPHSRQAMTELKLALRDRNAGVRLAVLRALTTFRMKEVEVPETEMAALIDDKDTAVRAGAIRVLPTFRLDAPVLNRLVDCLGDKHRLVRDAAFQQLRWRVQSRDGLKLGVELRRRAFAKALAMPDARHRRDARAALRSKRYEPKGEEFLLGYLEHEDPKVRAEAAITFGQMELAAHKHLPQLRKLLKDRYARVRAAAEWAIGEIQGTGKKGPGLKRLKLK